jgi:hypothetical protein
VSRFSAASLKEWFWTVFGLNFLLVVAQDIFGADGPVWIGVRLTVLAVLTALLLAWLYAWLRDASASEGGWRWMAVGWAPPLLLAVAIVGVLVLAGLLVDDIAS